MSVFFLWEKNLILQRTWRSRRYAIAGLEWIHVTSNFNISGGSVTTIVHEELKRAKNNRRGGFLECWQELKTVEFWWRHGELIILTNCDNGWGVDVYFESRLLRTIRTLRAIWLCYITTPSRISTSRPLKELILPTSSLLQHLNDLKIGRN